MKSRRVAVLRLVVPLYSLVNLTLLAFGYDPLPFETTAVETTLTALIGAVGLVYAWWKNNNLTRMAGRTQDHLTESIPQQIIHNQTKAD